MVCVSRLTSIDTVSAACVAASSASASAALTCAGKHYPFSIDGFRKHALYHGLDDIGQTLQHAADIRAFEARHRQQFPWLFKE